MRRKKISEKKLLLTLVSVVFYAGMGALLFPGSIRGSCRINDISLERMEKFTKLTVYADQPFEFAHFSLEKGGGKPYRVIVDCKDAIHNLPQHNFKSGLPVGTIHAIRTSQFQSEPERIVRIVLDVGQPVIYKVVEKGEDKTGVIAILTAQDPSFTAWFAAKSKSTSSESRMASSVSRDEIVKEMRDAEHDPLTTTEDENRSDLAQSRNVKAQEVKKGSAFEGPLSFADTSKAEAKKRLSQVSLAKQEARKREAETVKDKSEQSSDRVILATAGASPDVFSVRSKEDKELPLQQGQYKKADAGVEKRALSPYSLQAPLDKKTEESSSDAQREALKETSSGRPAKQQWAKKEQISPQKEATAHVGEAPKAKDIISDETKTYSENLNTKEGEIALLSPEDESVKEEAGLPESLVVISEPKGALLEAVPKRGIIYYHSEGRRDPFVPITERIATQLGQIPLPTFESLKLVGVLRDEAGNRALLEDDRGYGYIMKNGDSIKNGYVISVEENKVIFQIQEYGWSKTIALELSN